MRWTWIAACCLASPFAACGSPADDGDAGPIAGLDAGSPNDAGERDATPGDAGAPDTGPPDAGPPDAGPPDTDGDGVPDHRDCDPADDTIGAASSRDCSTACGSGTEECTDGVWAACTAPTACLCDAPGTRRVVPCGMCGEQSEECTDGTWQPVSSCLGQGLCEPGGVETSTNAFCGVSERLCRTDCMWGEWSTVVPSGECIPGRSNCSAFPELDRLCTDECVWVDNPDCDVNP